MNTILARGCATILRSQRASALPLKTAISTHVIGVVYPEQSSLKSGLINQIRKRSSGTNVVGVKYPQPVPATVDANRDNVLDLFSLKGKVASISGSSGGIGFEVARAYAQAGADVALWYLGNPIDESVKQLESTYGVKVRAYKAEVTNPDDVNQVIQQQIKDFGKIDVFVANAGVIWGGKDSILDEVDDKQWERVVRVNYDGVYNCAKAVGKHFRERGQGNFIITGSMSGHIVNVPDTMAAYCSSKAAVIHLGKSLALEWIKFARVNIVSPGYMQTEMTLKKHDELIENWAPLSPMARMGHPRELVGAYLYLASDASSFTTGADIIVDGGYTLL